jgi:predicted RNA-binding protein with EMAP domain
VPQDISKDPRILMVERVIRDLKEMTINKKYKLPASKEKTLEAIGKLNSTIKNIKFSYISPVDLADYRSARELELMATQFWDALSKNYAEIQKNKLSELQLKFIFNILKGFRDRLKLGNEISIDKAIDIIAVKIISVSKLDNKGNLSLCRVGDGKQILNIITNLPGIKSEMVLPAAILPPRQFGSEVSEAMFCSGKNMSEMQKYIGERILNLPDDSLKEVNHQILDLFKIS